MLKPELGLLTWLLLFLVGPGPHLRFARADIGTASRYSPPYTPTACYGNDFSEFPTSNLFAAAGEGIWDNGAACGRQYLVRCISAPVPQSCVPGQTIQIKIVDRAQSSSSRPSRDGSSIVLSETAFAAIANPAVHYLNVEYQQL
ncbi:EG45-like domain containing protein [Salvia miltiorrhiza]|uniref:EG45-like domain containing protein n=1 Tax=Salvia miltiorrhiza TaxID=226208 RepID=UPI0025ABF39A|nr:EG45-like domain containing protein [Salvia miltiorrhiza]